MEGPPCTSSDRWFAPSSSSASRRCAPERTPASPSTSFAANRRLRSSPGLMPDRLVRGRGPVPNRSARPAHLHRRGLRRLRLGRRVVRASICAARVVPLREHRRYVAIAPLTGMSLSQQSELAAGLLIRTSSGSELASHWPEARGLLPKGSVGSRTGVACSSCARISTPAMSLPMRRRRSPTR